MKKSKKNLSLNKLVISKLTNFTMIQGGDSELNCQGTVSRNPIDPFCAPKPPPTETCMNCPSVHDHAC